MHVTSVHTDLEMCVRVLITFGFKPHARVTCLHRTATMWTSDNIRSRNYRIYVSHSGKLAKYSLLSLAKSTERCISTPSWISFTIKRNKVRTVLVGYSIMLVGSRHNFVRAPTKSTWYKMTFLKLWCNLKGPSSLWLGLKWPFSGFDTT